MSDYVLPDSIVEVKPTGKTTGEVVWEWHLWDHLIQDHDSTKANFGDVAAHPELVDVNFGEDPIAPAMARPGRRQGRSARPGPDEGRDRRRPRPRSSSRSATSARPRSRAQRVNPDWTHFNAVAYNAELDQIVMSVHEFSEIWIIDHSTTTAEAAGHTGGRSGKGGDLLYRWGNPRVYRAGTKADQTALRPAQRPLDSPAAFPAKGTSSSSTTAGTGRAATIRRSTRSSSRSTRKGRYARSREPPSGRTSAVWSYSAPKKSDFYSSFISGAHRLPNGNTLICSGANGTIFEVTPDKEIVWKYVNPVKGGFGPGGSAPAARRRAEPDPAAVPAGHAGACPPSRRRSWTRSRRRSTASSTRP